MTVKEAKEVFRVKAKGSLSHDQIEEAWILRRRQLSAQEASAFGKNDRADVCHRINRLKEAKAVLLKDSTGPRKTKRKPARQKRSARKTASTNPFVKLWNGLVGVWRFVVAASRVVRKIMIGIWRVLSWIVKFLVKASEFFEDVGIPVPVFVIIILLVIALSASGCSDLIQNIIGRAK